MEARTRRSPLRSDRVATDARVPSYFMQNPGRAARADVAVQSECEAQRLATAMRRTGFTTTTPALLYWVSHSPAGGKRPGVLHGGPGARHA